MFILISILLAIIQIVKSDSCWNYGLNTLSNTDIQSICCTSTVDCFYCPGQCCYDILATTFPGSNGCTSSNTLFTINPASTDYYTAQSCASTNSNCKSQSFCGLSNSLKARTLTASHDVTITMYQEGYSTTIPFSTFFELPQNTDRCPVTNCKCMDVSDSTNPTECSTHTDYSINVINSAANVGDQQGTGQTDIVVQSGPFLKTENNFVNIQLQCIKVGLNNMGWVASNTLKVTFDSQCTATDTFTQKYPSLSFWKLQIIIFNAGYVKNTNSLGWDQISIGIQDSWTQSNSNCWPSSCQLVQLQNQDPPNGVKTIVTEVQSVGYWYGQWNLNLLPFTQFTYKENMYFECQYPVKGASWPYATKYFYNGPYHIKYYPCAANSNYLTIANNFKILKIQVPIAKQTGLLSTIYFNQTQGYDFIFDTNGNRLSQSLNSLWVSDTNNCGLQIRKIAVSGIGEGTSFNYNPSYWSNKDSLTQKLGQQMNSYLTLARPLTVGNFNPSSLYMLGLGSNFNFLTYNDPLFIEIQISYVGCVKDSISLTSAGSIFNETSIEIEPFSQPKQLQFDFTSWFKLDVIQATNALCVNSINEYWLGNCQNSQEIYNQATDKVSMVVDTTSALNPIYINAASAFGVYEACLWAKSTEEEYQKKPLYFEVCGTEDVTLTDISQVQLNHSAQENTTSPYSLGPLMKRFVSNSTNCPITQFQLWERDSSGKDTLFKNSDHSNITLHYSDGDFLTAQSTLTITTQIDNYYNRTLILKNKPLNGITSVVKEIQIDVNVTGCELCNITYSDQLPSSGNFSMVKSFPMLFLDLNYTHTKSETEIDFSSMFKKTIEHCKFTSYQIEKVEGKVSKSAVTKGSWVDIIKMSEDGKFSVLKLTEPVQWMVYLSANTSLSSSGLSKQPMIDLTIEPKLNVVKYAPVFPEAPDKLIDFTGDAASVQYLKYSTPFEKDNATITMTFQNFDQKFMTWDKEKLQIQIDKTKAATDKKNVILTIVLTNTNGLSTSYFTYIKFESFDNKAAPTTQVQTPQTFSNSSSDTTSTSQNNNNITPSTPLYMTIVIQNITKTINYNLPEISSDEKIVFVKGLDKKKYKYDVKKNQLIIEDELLTANDVKQGQTFQFNKVNETKNTVVEKFTLQLTILAPEGYDFKKKEAKKADDDAKKKKDQLKIESIKIDTIGQMQIKFSQPMEILPLDQYNSSWIHFAIQNNEGISKTGKSDNQDSRQLQSQNQSDFAFTWNATSFVDKILFIQLNFTSPESISPTMKYDKFVMNIDPKYIHIFKAKGTDSTLDLPQDGTKLSIRPQLPNNALTKSLQNGAAASQTNMKIVLVISFLMNQFLSGSMIYMSALIRSLQISTHYPMFTINFPAVTQIYIGEIIIVAMFDIFDNPYIGYSDIFNISQNTNLSDQTQALGYGPNSTMINLGSICIYIFFYLLRVLMLVFLKFSVECCGIGRKKIKKVKKGVFWNDFIGLTLDGYIEFIICGIINFQAPIDVLESNKNGDIISNLFGYYCLITSLIVIPVFLLNMYSQSLKKIQSVEFENRWGALYEGVRTNNMGSLAFNGAFVVRRIFLSSFILFLHNWPVFQLITTCYINLFHMIHLANSKPFLRVQLNRIEMTNELLLCFTTFFVMCFTDWVPASQQGNYGWLMLYSIFVTIFLNAVFVLWYAGKNLMLLFRKYCINWIKMKIKQRKQQQYERQQIQLIDLNKREERINAFAAHMAQIMEENDKKVKINLNMPTISEHASESQNKSQDSNQDIQQHQNRPINFDDLFQLEKQRKEIVPNQFDHLFNKEMNQRQLEESSKPLQIKEEDNSIASKIGKKFQKQIKPVKFKDQLGQIIKENKNSRK